MTRLRLLALAVTAVAAGTACKAGPAGGSAHRRQPAGADPPAVKQVVPHIAARGVARARVVAPTIGTAMGNPAAHGEDWNSAQIHWLDYTQGLARAKTEHKPVCLVFFATWCPHCKNYSHVFEDPRVVAEAKKFVMIRVDTDREPAVSSRYALDGAYVPRTYFLTPGGKVAQAVRAPRLRFQFFYDEHNPASLLGGMQKAEKLVD